MIKGTPTQLELHRIGCTDDYDNCCKRLDKLGNYKYTVVTKEYFLERRSLAALAKRFYLSRSTVVNMIRYAIDKLNEIEEREEET